MDAPDSGNIASDGQGVGTATAQVHRERVETGNGGRCTATGRVSVPLTCKGTAVDDGALFVSTLIL